jgi:hypothetical protein
MPGAPFNAFLSLAMGGYRLRKQTTVFLPLPTDSFILGGVQHGMIVRNAVEESRNSQPIHKHLEPLDISKDQRSGHWVVRYDGRPKQSIGRISEGADVQTYRRQSDRQ